MDTGGAPRCGLDKRPMRPGGSALWPGQAPDEAWGKCPMAWASVRCGHGKRTASKLGMRPVTLRRISQHPPVTSTLGLSSRLALPAHFHCQPGFLMCGLLINFFTNRDRRKRFSQNERRADLQKHASKILIFAWGLSCDLSKFSDDFTPFFDFEGP